MLEFAKNANPNRLSRELRHAGGGFLENRRKAVVLALSAGGCMGYILLYQMGLVRHLKEPPLPRFDADKVDGSGEAYEKLSTPDAALGLASYGVTAVLASMGGKRRHATDPWMGLAFGAKVALDAGQAAKLSWDQWAKHRAFCFWCLTAAAATFATIPLAVPEAVASLRFLFRRNAARSGMRRRREMALRFPQPGGRFERSGFRELIRLGRPWGRGRAWSRREAGNRGFASTIE